MPELPEVETIVRQLRPLLLGQRVIDQEIIDQKLSHLSELPMQGATIRGIKRVGKQILFTFEDSPIQHLGVHLRMTGSLIWNSTGEQAAPSNVGAEPLSSFDSAKILIKHQTPGAKHHRWLLTLERGTVIFSDIRRFGTVTPYERVDQILRGAIDPLENEFSISFLQKICRSTARPIKVLLLDQAKIVGIGNIYASEILFTSGIDPRRSASSLQVPEIKRLHQAVRKILTAAIKHNGTTFSDYRDSKGERGSFQNLLLVYDKEGKTCRRCENTMIHRIIQAQRSTFFCSSCQH